MELVPDAPDEPQTMAAAVGATIAALAPPASDAAVVALARKMASAIDGMGSEQLAAMIGQTAPQLLRVLQELEARSAKRRSAERAARPSPVSQLRAAHARHPAKRKRMG
jgi:hypothetical protein